MRIHEHGRDGLERLCRHAVRPRFALHRLSQGEDERRVRRMKRLRGGSSWLGLTPGDPLLRSRRPTSRGTVRLAHAPPRG